MLRCSHTPHTIGLGTQRQRVRDCLTVTLARRVASARAPPHSHAHTGHDAGRMHLCKSLLEPAPATPLPLRTPSTGGYQYVRRLRHRRHVGRLHVGRLRLVDDGGHVREEVDPKLLLGQLLHATVRRHAVRRRHLESAGLRPKAVGLRPKAVAEAPRLGLGGLSKLWLRPNAEGCGSLTLEGTSV